MITSISSWAEQIIIAIMIATIFEMILPECKNKKYVKTVIGLYILFTILSPIIKLYNKGDISLASSEYLKSTNEVSSTYKNFDSVTGNNIQDTYILSLKQDINGKLNNKGYTTGTIKIEIDESNENYGRIKSLYISMSKKAVDKTNDNNSNNISIDKVEISNSINKELNNDISKKTDKEISEIKEFLSNEYGVEIENIKID